jgi:hypothetical protein
MTFDLSAALTALLGRMETNPSEFFANTYKWDFLWREGVKEVLTEDELKLLAEGVAYVRRAEINNSILHSLLEEPEHEYEKVQYGGTGASIAGVLGQKAVIRTQTQQLKMDMEAAKLSAQQQYNNALGQQHASNSMNGIGVQQNFPSDYLKSFFK